EAPRRRTWSPRRTCRSTRSRTGAARSGTRTETSSSVTAAGDDGSATARHLRSDGEVVDDAGAGQAVDDDLGEQPTEHRPGAQLHAEAEEDAVLPVPAGSEGGVDEHQTRTEQPGQREGGPPEPAVGRGQEGWLAAQPLVRRGDHQSRARRRVEEDILDVGGDDFVHDTGERAPQDGDVDRGDDEPPAEQDVLGEVAGGPHEDCQAVPRLDQDPVDETEDDAQDHHEHEVLELPEGCATLGHRDCPTLGEPTDSVRWETTCGMLAPTCAQASTAVASTSATSPASRVA